MKTISINDAIPDDACHIVYRGDSVDCFFVDDEDVKKSLSDNVRLNLNNLRSEHKHDRCIAVNQIIVSTTSGKAFNGDETSQQRMTSAIAVLYANELISWTLANNVVDFVTREELAEALRLAVFKQTELWRLAE